MITSPELAVCVTVTAVGKSRAVYFIQAGDMIGLSSQYMCTTLCCPESSFGPVGVAVWGRTQKVTVGEMIQNKGV